MHFSINFVFLSLTVAVSIDRSNWRASSKGLNRNKRSDGESLKEININVEKTYSSSWDIKNNCGPRPSGPMYPAPDGPVTTVIVDLQAECDIIPGAIYLPEYNCTAPCQPCEWVLKNYEKCPPVKDQLDWECDPRVRDCGSQYGNVTVSTWIDIVPNPALIHASNDIPSTTMSTSTSQTTSTTTTTTTTTATTTTTTSPPTTTSLSSTTRQTILNNQGPIPHDLLTLVGTLVEALNGKTGFPTNDFSRPQFPPHYGGAVSNVFNISPIMTNTIEHEKAADAKTAAAKKHVWSETADSAIIKQLEGELEILKIERKEMAEVLKQLRDHYVYKL